MRLQLILALTGPRTLPKPRAPILQCSTCRCAITDPANRRARADIPVRVHCPACHETEMIL